ARREPDLHSERRLTLQPRKELNLFDSTCLIAGIIIGAGLYQMAPTIAHGAHCWWGVLLIWVVGGLLSLCGALCYAELATAFPQQGGDYVYLSRAYGRWAGFLFGWIQLAIVRPGDIAIMAFAFAMYAQAIHDPFAETSFPYSQQLFAAAAVVVLTAINIAGVREGKWTQNALTTAKVLGLLAVIGVAVIAPQRAAPAAPAGEDFETMPILVALILVLFTYGGWNEMAYVAAEVKNPRRNITRALVLGTVAVTVLYLLANGAFLYTLGYDGVVASEVVAADAVSSVFPEIGGRLISALVCVSALGAVSGLVFAGARISYAVGVDHPAFRTLGRLHPRTGTPVWALVLQAAISVTLIIALGSFLDTVLYTAAAVYAFYLATCLSVIVLRRKEPCVERPYRVTGYPVTTLLFCAVCALLIYSAFDYKPLHASIACALIPLGLPIYWYTSRRRPPVGFPVITERPDADASKRP
ncbi:MAG: amino acid permease, partial [Phycisphaerales bacterium]